MTQDMKHTIRFFFLLVALITGAAGEIKAITEADIFFNYDNTKGSVSVAEGGITTVASGTKVIIVVTPNDGYSISAGTIIVEKMINPTDNARRRTSGLSGDLDVTHEESNNYSFVIPSDYDGAYVTVNFYPTPSGGFIAITSLSEITNLTTGRYELAGDINASGDMLGEFKGELNGNNHTIYGLQHPLFSSTNGAKIYNLNFEDVNITSGDDDGDAGVITAKAKGATRIYNCGILPSAALRDAKNNITGFMGSSISGSRYTGGFVGHLDDEARVINCFSYANITGGTYVGGIVGYNNVATTSSNLKTMVMNCLFYGDITGGTNKAPIYNGQLITNRGDDKGVGNYNYFRLEAPYVQPTGVTYNCALGAEDRFLQRFEFYRHLLNSHRELAGWWATGTYSGDTMLKWVLEPSQLGTATPYPILKESGKYPSVVNIDVNHSELYEGRDLTVGRKLGTLSVTIQMGSGGAVYAPPTGAAITTSSLTLNITDKDPDHYNFNYYKVQLPYYNDVGTKNYNGNRVVTGWKIVKINDSETGTGSYSTGEDVTYTDGELTATPYNFADRNCTNKDLYSQSGRVFNQGAYWDVPYGVTAITIEPYWAKCVYLADAYADVVYNTAMTSATNVPNVGGGEIYTNGNSYTIAGESQKVFTDKGKAIAKDNSGLFQGVTGSPSSQTVYDYAVVLVGNYHFYGNLDADMSKPYTVTSVDLDGDNEPDYSYILRFDSRKNVHPVRVDFINIPGLGMAQKSTGGTGTYNFGIMQPKGWFESTNTSLFRVTQFEYDNKDRIAAPYILQGGVMEQWVNGQSGGHANLTTYFHVGGNVWFKEFHRGTHQDAQYDANHSPVSVTGGDFDQFHLTGLYRADVTIRDDNAECYITGGRFGVVAGTGMDGIGHPTNHTNGNITWIIDNADIKEFYAGSFNADKPAQGNLHTIVNGGHIDFFCGGPKFGDMNSGRTVTTTATGCTFGTFFGAGYGGSSYSRQAPRNHSGIMNFPHTDTQAGYHASWNAWLEKFYTQSYSSTYGGVSTQFSYQFIPESGNAKNVARIFVEYVKFSLATTHSVTSTLTGCTITGNFYGGGSLGKVDGNVTSTLTNCTVNGSVFGAGFSGNLPTVEVDDPNGFATEPYYYEALGTYRAGVKGATTTYTWEKKKSGDPWVDNTSHTLYTTENLNDLGTVSGNVTLNILGDQTHITGDVYGGAAEAKSNTDYYKETDPVLTTATTVNLLGGTIDGSAYGGGLGNLGKLNSSDPTKYDVEPVAADVGNTTLNLNGMAVTDYKTEYGTWGESFFDHAVESDPYTIPDASKGCIVKGNIFGCNNLNGTPKGHAKVHIYKTQNAASSKIIEKIGIDAMSEAVETGSARDKLNYWIAQAKKNGVDEEVVNAAQNVYNQGDEATDEIITAQIESLTTITESSAAKNQYDVKAVYGGGNLAPYIPTNSELPYTTANENTLNKVFAEVIIDGCDRTSIGQVYGGGNAASSPATKVDVNGTYEIGELFGGGNGKDDISKDGGVTWLKNPGANVGYKEYADNATNAQTPSDRQTNYGYGSGKAEVNIYGGRIHSIYGGSNTKGNVRRIAVAMLEELQGSDNKPKCAFNVDEAYGGGKSATMDGEAHLEMKCIPGLKAAYGGAENADIQNNVTINITNGKFSQVFGGNNMGGRIMGGITVNVEETGCRPVIIGELYGGGNRASYSVYGYKPETDEDGIVYDEFDKIRWLPLVKDESITVSGEDYTALTTKYPYPRVNVKSFTSIGEVYGGGYGTTATMVGDPHVNINVVMGDKTNHNEAKIDAEGTLDIIDETEDHVETTRQVKYPTHTEGKIGAIRNVFGGGNAARVVGDTYVNIGTDETVDYVTTASGEDDPRTGISVVGADIRGNVYGGGNKAEVTGSTNVNIGKQPTTP